MATLPGVLGDPPWAPANNPPAPPAAASDTSPVPSAHDLILPRGAWVASGAPASPQILLNTSAVPGFSAAGQAIARRGGLDFDAMRPSTNVEDDRGRQPSWGEQFKQGFTDWLDSGRRLYGDLRRLYTGEQPQVMTLREWSEKNPPPFRRDELDDMGAPYPPAQGP